MARITTPGEYRVGPHIVKVQAGQSCTHDDSYDVEPVDYYDAMQAALDAGASTANAGDAVAGSFSKINNNPFTDGDEPSTFVQEADPEAPWLVDTVMIGGSKYTNVDRVFICRQSHLSQAQWEPVVDLVGAGLLALWTIMPLDSGVWESGVTYAIDDEVDYLGVLYRCIQAHTSQVGWEPPNVPSLWETA